MRTLKSGLVLGVAWELPPWVAEFDDRFGIQLPEDDEGKMALAIEILERHITEKTGGPFAALTYDLETRHVISIGVNLVVAEDNPILHAENVATQTGTKRIRNFQFSGKVGLVTTAQMCGMCHNGGVWGGYGEILIGASAEDTERETGFDEGDIPADWRQRLERRKIVVRTGILRDRVIGSFQRYVAEGGVIYNGQRD